MTGAWILETLLKLRLSIQIQERDCPSIRYHLPVIYIFSARPLSSRIVCQVSDPVFLWCQCLSCLQCCNEEVDV